MSTASRRAVPLLLLLAALIPLVLTPAPAGAATTGTAQLRVGHFVAGLGPVVADVAAQPLGGPVAYGELADYVDVPAGASTITFRAADAPAGSAPLASVDVTLTPGSAGTAVASGTEASPTALAFSDDLSAPASGTARVRLLHLAPEVPEVDGRVLAGPASVIGTEIYTGAGYGQATAYMSLPGGTYDVDMLRAGTEQVLLAVRGVTVRAGSVYTIVGTGSGEQPVEVRGFVDVAGAGSVPSGGVAAGFGGAAASGGLAGDTGGSGLAVVAAAALLAAAAPAVRRRLRTRG